jgi:prepilin-type N-terminal cleavage/methylation domain
MKNHLRFGNQQGFTLIEVITALVIMSFLSLMTLTFIDSVRNEESKQETLTYRNNEASQFFMQMAQPTYVGALANYPENKKLLECMETDNVHCETGKEYALQAFDLATGKAITNLDSGAEGYVDTVLTFKIHCPHNASSCDKLDYLNIKISTKTKGKLGIYSYDEKTVTVEPKKTNILTFIPNTETKSGAPANILIFIDGSNSMSTIKDSFKTSLATLLDKVKTMDATVGVFSLNAHTTPAGNGIYTLEPDGVTKKPITEWESLPANSFFYANVDLRLSYKTQETFFEFTHDMTPAQRASNIDAINKQIDEIFKSTTVTRDAPLCGFMRALQDISDGKSAFKMTDGTPTLMMVLTNEDDESVFANVGEDLNNGRYSGWYNNRSFVCAKSLVEKWQKNDAIRQYSGKLNYYEVSGTADYKMDGVPATVAIDRENILAPYNGALKVGDSCMGEMASFKKTLDQRFKDMTGEYSDFPGATYLGKNNITSCKVVQWKINVAEGSTATNECNGKYSTANYPELVPDTCKFEDIPVSKSGISGMGTYIGEVYAPTNTKAHATHDITMAIYDILKNSFKVGNFSFVAVINPSSGVCPLTAGASVGTTYEKLAAYPDLNSEIVPICSSSYDSKLVESSEFLKSFSLSNIQTPVATGARIKGVDILRGSKIITPTEGADYAINGDTVNFTTGYLLATDIVRVYLR